MIILTKLTNVRFCQDDCTTTQLSHHKLLNSDVCMDFADRLSFKLAGTVDCELAERETRLSIHQCAAQKWRSESEIAKLYHRMTDSYWKLLLWIMPIVLVSVIMWFQSLNTQRINQTFERMMDKVSSRSHPKAIEAPPLSSFSPRSGEKEERKRKKKRKDRVLYF